MEYDIPFIHIKHRENIPPGGLWRRLEWFILTAVNLKRSRMLPPQIHTGNNVINSNQTKKEQLAGLLFFCLIRKMPGNKENCFLADR